MLVKFRFPWFGPSEVVIKDKIQKISGMRFKKGEQEVPDELKSFLPKDAEILKEASKRVFIPVSDDLKDYDQERKDADAVAKIAEEADAAALKMKQDRMAHARSSKGARRGKDTVE